ncbi:GNAT family N-acetyltransferase [Novilysobacter antarcticus]|uniref:GNAT family N-acetyltransferase n=1 Tax=Novilysobacter antarcticus TaxID=2862543 RepID=UPI001C9968FB|nr:GNAT family N-acetyltransferase [Lysobacter antarcticus]
MNSIHPLGPTLETSRLLLRPQRVEDFEGVAEMLGDEEAARYIGGHMPRSAAWRRFLQMPGAWAMQGFAMFSVIDKHSGQWLGQTGPWHPVDWPGPEIGWSFRRAAWGQGYALEAATAATEWAMEELGWPEVIHSIDPDNHASQRLAQRLGSSLLRMGQLPEPYDDKAVQIWGQSREQWRARKTQAPP